MKISIGLLLVSMSYFAISFYSPAKEKMDFYDSLSKKGLTIYQGEIMSNQEALAEKKANSAFDYNNRDMYQDVFNEDPEKMALAIERMRTHAKTPGLTLKQRKLLTDVVGFYDKTNAYYAKQVKPVK